jgi:uncharacterized delta-60 repeat protein
MSIDTMQRARAHPAVVMVALAALLGMALPVHASGAVPPSLDGSFGTRGAVTLPRAGHLASSTRLASGGYHLVSTDLRPAKKNGEPRLSLRLTRTLPNGMPDPAYGSGGTVLDERFSRKWFLSAVDAATQPDGATTVVLRGFDRGRDARDGALPGALVVVVRYDAQGHRVPTFGGGDGLVVVSTERQEEFRSGLVRPDGRIVLVGLAGGGLGERGPYHVVALGLRADGTADPAFGNGRRVRAPGTRAFWASYGDAVLTPEGDVVAAVTELGARCGGRGCRRLTLAQADALFRLRPDGAVDASYGAGAGRRELVSRWEGRFSGRSIEEALASGITGIAQPPGGGILLVGGTATPAPALFTRRYDAAGVPARDYGPADTGRSVARVGELQDGFWPGAAAVMTDGRLVVAGSGGPDGNDLQIVRLTADGALDPSFTAGTANVAPVHRRAVEEWPVGLHVEPGGRLVLAGVASDVSVRARSVPFAAVVLRGLVGGDATPSAMELTIDGPVDGRSTVRGRSAPGVPLSVTWYRRNACGDWVMKRRERPVPAADGAWQAGGTRALPSGYWRVVASRSATGDIPAARAEVEGGGVGRRTPCRSMHYRIFADEVRRLLSRDPDRDDGFSATGSAIFFGTEGVQVTSVPGT